MKFLVPLFLSTLAFGQVQIEGRFPPKGFSKAQLSQRSIVSLPSLNNFALLQAAKAEELVHPGPFKFGEAVNIDLDMTAGHGEWTSDRINKRRIWRAMVKSPGAVSISILFSEFYLPPGAEFYVVGKQGDKLGAFTGDVNNKDDGKFATAPIAGDTVILEYNEPAESPRGRKPAAIKVHRVVHGFRKTILDTDSSGRCNIDVLCPEGRGKKDQIDAVGMMITADGQRFCSGTMVNNVRQDGKQYFLTAHHCIFSDVSYFMVGFNYQWNYCRSSTNSTNIANEPKPQLAQGMKLISQWEPSDYALLLIKETIPDSYNVFMAGWDTSSQAATNVFGVHHPSGDAKKISLYNGRLQPASWGEAPKRYHWEVPKWSKGVTEPGSSGSALFNSKGQVIGHLHGGQSSCDFPTGYDLYGAFSSDWSAPPNANSKLSTWLNPTKLPISSLSGYPLKSLRKRPQNNLVSNNTLNNGLVVPRAKINNLSASVDSLEEAADAKDQVRMSENQPHHAAPAVLSIPHLHPK